MVAPEALLLECSGFDPDLGRLISSTGPLLAPYDALVQDVGWLVDPTSARATAPFDDPGLDSDQRAMNAMLVACDYAVRRGAATVSQVRKVLTRESPVGLVVRDIESKPGRLAQNLGVSAPASAEPPAAFARRQRAHAELSFPCDPVLSFQPRTLDWDMGDNTLSSFIVHNEGLTDGVSISGERSERWGVSVGLPPLTRAESLAEIEREVAMMPSFLSGVSSSMDGHALEVGWAAGRAPAIERIGESMRVWTKALFDLDAVDVRIVFAPTRGMSAKLTAMRARARSLRLQRESMVADPTRGAPESTHRVGN